MGSDRKWTLQQSHCCGPQSKADKIDADNRPIAAVMETLDSMNVLLISVQRNLDIIGLKGLHHLLLDRGYRSFLLYLPDFDPASTAKTATLNRFVREVNPGFIGVSLMAMDYYLASQITRAIKQAFPEIPVIWGGVHPSTAPEMCLQDADYVCIGEGDQAILDLAEAARQGDSFRDVKNIGFLENGTLRRNPLHLLTANLDELPISRQIPENSFVMRRGAVAPLQKRDLVKFHRYRGGLYKIMTSRGCPHACSYCVNGFLKSLYPHNPVRRRSIDHVMRELELAAREGPRLTYIDITDDCFLASPMEYLKAFCREYKARIRVPFLVKGTPQYFTREKMDLLVDAGLSWVNIGLQSGSDRTCRDVYCRKSSAAEFLRAAELVNQYSVAAFYDIIVENPFESLEDELQTAETLMATPRPFYPQLFSLMFYHGTQLYERATRECPEHLKAPLDQDFYSHESRDINALIEIAGILHRPLVHWLIAAFRRDRHAMTTRLALALAVFYTKTFLRPVVYFRLIRRSFRGSFWRSCASLPLFLSERIVRRLEMKGWHWHAS